MISIIVSSYKDHFYNQFKQNVDETIGVPYEIIKIENPSIMSICEAYNRGAGLAKYSYLCFCHEDILFKTTNWGSIVLDSFRKDSELGLLGVAGSNYKTLVPSSYYGVDSERLYLNIYQNPKNSTTSLPDLLYSNPEKKENAEVVCLDGVWLCTTKEIASKIPFDSGTFKNYHCYDVDFSLSVSLSYKVVVTYDVAILHFSRGNFDKTWITESIKLSSKWKNYLPRSTTPIGNNYRNKMERDTLIDFFVKMFDNSFSPVKMLKVYNAFKKYMNLPFTDNLAIYYALSKHSIKYVLGIRSAENG